MGWSLGRAKLTEPEREQIRYIRAEHGWTYMRIAQLYGVSEPTISYIVQGRRDLRQWGGRRVRDGELRRATLRHETLEIVAEWVRTDFETLTDQTVEAVTVRLQRLGML
jgi:transcriptional regulator with XRE-family HTH domain